MALKLVSFNVEESMHEKIKKVCEIEGIKQSDFFNCAIGLAFEAYQLEAGGGVNISLPSPFIFHPLSRERQEEIISFMNETLYQFGKLSGGSLDVGLNLIYQFMIDSFNTTEQEKQKKVEKFYKYLEVNND